MVGVVGLVESLPGRTAGELVGMTNAAEIRQFLLREVRGVRELLAERFAALEKLPLPAMPDRCPLCDSRLREAA